MAAAVGTMDGSQEGSLEGCPEGCADDCLEGCPDGRLLGSEVGSQERESISSREGVTVGLSVAIHEGCDVIGGEISIVDGS